MVFAVTPAEDGAVVVATEEVVTEEDLADDGRGSGAPFVASSVA